jgi:Bifunctional DNA primase/polymerase, N-terminal
MLHEQFKNMIDSVDIPEDALAALDEGARDITPDSLKLKEKRRAQHAAEGGLTAEPVNATAPGADPETPQEPDITIPTNSPYIGDYAEADGEDELSTTPTHLTFPSGLDEAAVYFTERGFALFPVQNKLPMTSNGFKDSNTHPLVILDMLRRRKDTPGLGIGIDCEKSGIFVLDVDVVAPQ